MKASILFIFVTLALDAIGLGLIIPVLPDVIRRFLTDEASIARVFGLFVAVYAALQFFTSPMLGRLSDRYGRRPILLLSLLGAGVDYVFMAIAPTLPLLFLGRVISGVSGASYTVANAYIADISDDSNRSKHFGIIGAGFGLGFIIGPAIGGLLANYGPQYPFLAAAVFNLLNFVFGLFVLPESLPPQKRRALDWHALNPLHSLRALGRVKGIGILILVFFLFHLAGQTHPTMWALYTHHKFAWTAREIGISLAVVGVMSALSQGVLTGYVVKWLGERRAVMAGCFGEAVSYVLYGLATSGGMIYGVLVFGSIFWVGQPALQSLMTRGIPENQQGEFQGALMSLVSITSIVNPVVMTSVFSFTTNRDGLYLPGSPYLLSALLLFAAGISFVRYDRRAARTVNAAAAAMRDSA